MLRFKSFTVFLILLLLASAFVAVFHHHGNIADDHDCPICFVSHNLQTDCQSTAFDGVPVVIEVTYSTPAPAFSENLFSASFSNRAPPA